MQRLFSLLAPTTAAAVLLAACGSPPAVQQAAPVSAPAAAPMPVAIAAFNMAWAGTVADFQQHLAVCSAPQVNWCDTRARWQPGTTQASPGEYPVRLRITDSSAGIGTHFQLRTFTAVVNAGAVPTVSASVSPAAVAEDDRTVLVFTVTRSTKLGTGTLVNLAWQGSARTVARTTVAIPAGATSATLRIRAKPDTVAEPDETVVLAVLPGVGYTAGASASAILVNDDLP